MMQNLQRFGSTSKQHKKGVFPRFCKKKERMYSHGFIEAHANEEEQIQATCGDMIWITIGYLLGSACKNTMKQGILHLTF